MYFRYNKQRVCLIATINIFKNRIERRWNMAAEQNEKPQKKKPFLIIFICIIMIALGLAAGIFISNLLNKSPDRTYDNNAEDIKKKNDDSSTSEEVADNIAIPCWDTLVMTADSTEQEVNFYNPEKNKNCDFQLTLTLENGTELWKSQLIPNGKAIYNITLNQPLKAGTYKAVIKYNCFSRNGSQLNGSNLNFNLIVEDKHNE